MTTRIDIPRCYRAMENIEVHGNPQGREHLLEEAIAKIQKDPKALVDRFIGLKSYAQFEDQRCDCAYGSGPTHGSIVFRIGRPSFFDQKDPPELGIDECYFLECIRDFEPVKVRTNTTPLQGLFNTKNNEHTLNLYNILSARQEALKTFLIFADPLRNAMVESHESVTPPKPKEDLFRVKRSDGEVIVLREEETGLPGPVARWLKDSPVNYIGAEGHTEVREYQPIHAMKDHAEKLYGALKRLQPYLNMVPLPENEVCHTSQVEFDSATQQAYFALMCVENRFPHLFA